MLNFSEFQDYVKMTIPERLPEEYQGAQIRSHEVEKNNGLVLHGITVTPEDSNIAPNIYLDGYFKQYEEGKDLDEVLDQITHNSIAIISDGLQDLCQPGFGYRGFCHEYIPSSRERKKSMMEE